MKRLLLQNVCDLSNNMARFIRSQTLTLLEKLNELDADEQADICESLHDHADELYRSCLARFGDDGENL